MHSRIAFATVERCPAPRLGWLRLRPWLAGCGALAGGAGMLQLFPDAELGVFARSAAQLAGLFTGAPVLRVAQGWMLPFPDVPVVVTAACSATSYLLLAAALIAWHYAQRKNSFWWAIPVGIGAACPLTIAVNALRVISVTQAHRWISPHLPASYDAVVHLATGVAVFLPSLIGTQPPVSNPWTPLPPFPLVIPRPTRRCYPTSSWGRSRFCGFGRCRSRCCSRSTFKATTSSKAT